MWLVGTPAKANALPVLAAYVLSLGFGFGAMRVLGKQRVVEWKPCLEHVLSLTLAVSPLHPGVP